jgi:hypothetical protein
MTVPLNPEEQITAQDVSQPTSSSTPASVKVASPTKSDPDQILGSKELIDKESDESDESDESKESNETSESQNSKEEENILIPSHQTNVTKTVQPSKDSIVDVSAPQVPNTKPIATVQMSEPDAVPAVPTIRDATFLPFKREPNAKSPEESQMLNTN